MNNKIQNSKVKMKVQSLKLEDRYVATIGLEIHAELKTQSKMFCSCKNETFVLDDKRLAISHNPNTNVCPICLGMPGVLPVMNQQAVEWTILTGLALHCKIGHPLPRQSALSPRESALWCKWDRKNYFYPDLPKGYQISQYDLPIASNGWLKLKTKNEKRKTVGITRIHLEEDTGTLKHPEGRLEVNYSLADYNRAGVPLMELVTEPDIRSAQQAKDFCQKYQLILRYLGVSDAEMEKGQLRCEVNISLRKISNFQFPISKQASKPKNQNSKLGTKVEIKNLNSFKAVENAIEYEIERQIKALESGEKIVQETRGWDDGKQKTYTMRIKETSADYRYFPEPDLPAIRLARGSTRTKNADQRGQNIISIEEIKERLPELPDEKFERYIKEYDLREADAEVIINDIEKSKYFEKCLILDTKYKILASKIVNWIINEVPDLTVSAKNLVELVNLIDKGEISGKIAKDILPEMKKGKSASAIIKEKELRVVSSEREIEKIVAQVIKDNPEAVAKIKAGKTQVIGFLVGQVMSATKGQANPQLVQRLIRNKIK